VDFKTHAAFKNLKKFAGAPASVNNVTVWSVQSNLDPKFIHNLPMATGGLPQVDQWNKKFDLNVLATTGTITITGTGSTPGGGISATGTGTPGRVTGTGTPTVSSTGPRVVGTRGTSSLPPGRLATVANEAIRRNVLLTNTVLANNRVNTAVQTKSIKAAYADTSFRFEYRDKSEPQTTLQVASIKTKITDTIMPVNAYKNLLDSKIKWPAGILKIPKEEFLPAMAYPDIPEPAYKYLIEIDEEFLLPNLRLIPPNTLSLLRTNQKFIESYLMGLNYEMGKELLWREYPTDMRGSYFRQFWDVSGFVTPDTTPTDAETLKDIDPIHNWSNNSNLGKHNKRDKEGDAEQLVFAIKGDLLKKFPNTVIYAQKAIKDGDKKKILENIEDKTIFDKHVRFPLYQAEIKPDIKLLGFDLTIEEASGENTTQGFTDKHGWFFIIAEVPGEPHFGMDITYNPNEPGNPPAEPANFTWNDLSWENFDENLTFVKSDIAPKNAKGFGGAFKPPNDLKKGTWGKTSADMASILFQQPVMVAIHSTEMLDVKVPLLKAGIFAEMITLKEYALKKNFN
jgi:hypothetical protein